MAGVLTGGLEKGIEALWGQEWSWPDWRETEPRHGGSVVMRCMQWREGSKDKVCDWDGWIGDVRSHWVVDEQTCMHTWAHIMTCVQAGGECGGRESTG